MHIVHDADAHRFTIHDDDGTRMGDIDYEPQGENRIAATHTRVGGKFRGRGLAEKLLDALAQYADENGLVIEPVCSYAAAAFGKNPGKYEGVMEKK